MAKTSSPKQTSVLNHEFGSESVNTQPIEEKQVVSTGNVQNGPGAPGPPIDVASKNQGLEQYGTPNPSQSGHGEKKRCGRPRKGQNTLRASPSSPRVLRSRSQEKPKAPEPSQHLANDGSNREKKKKKKKRVENVPVDEFSRIKRRVRYLLTRMNYEQNLIDAYSGEGWKGQSLEKIKPEKELQRAKSEILRCKLKIRDLFQRLDMSCAEGKLPESLFDSEGEIDSEDIFCAKCGSKELLASNDIILCDGYCERGFHQFCLEPPLLIEDIPPGDEGWLCPGCDCKVDCTDLVNDAHGTNLSISDSWEKVFPEAAASGNNLNDKSEFPSDDSEDDDYNPEGPELDEEEVKGGESSSSDNDSQYFSASDDLGVLPNKDKQYLGLPSDDSEDDDYNPNGKDTDEQARPDGSSSDFTSDSEDFSVAFDDKRISGEVQGGSTFSKSDHIKPNGERSKLCGLKGQSLNDELSSLLESAPGGEGVLNPLGKRHVGRLDYKKLHDEAYGNVSSSDSSDEEYMDTDVPKRRKSETGKGPLVPPNRKLGTDSQDMKDRQRDNESTPKRGANKTPDVEDTSNIPAESNKGSIGPHSRGGGTRSAYKRLGEATTQRLLEAFRENQYPDRPMKENLANELSITVSQVSKWFENCRRPSSRVGSSIAESASNKDTQIDNDPPVTEPEMLTENCSGNVKAAKSKGKVKLDNQTDPILLTCEGNGQNSKTPNSKSGKVMIDDQTDPILVIGERKGKVKVGYQTDPIVVTEEGNGQNSRTLNSEKRKVKIDNQTNPTLASKEVDGQNSKTPKSKRRKENIENQPDPTWVTEESSGQNSKTPKSNKKVKMDNQTDPTCVTEEGNGTNSKTPKSEKKKDKLDNQTDPTLVTEQGIGLKSKTPKSRKREVKIDNKTDPTLVTEEGNGQNSRTATSNKRKGNSDNKKDPNLGVEEEIQKQNVELVNSAKAKEVRRSGRIQSKKSVA